VITQSRLKELVSYDPDTGIFTSIVARGRAYLGKRLGTVNTTDHYLNIRLDGRRYGAHRLAFLYMTGEWPRIVDHIGSAGCCPVANRSDNRWLNLRNGSQSENLQNQRRPHRDNASGALGVTFDKARQKWKVSICRHYRITNVGRYDSKDEAIAAYAKAKKLLHVPGAA
jgi:hypothetical protein